MRTAEEDKARIRDWRTHDLTAWFQAVEILARDAGAAWPHEQAGAGGRSRLESLGCEVAVEEIYLSGLEDASTGC